MNSQILQCRTYPNSLNTHFPIQLQSNKPWQWQQFQTHSYFKQSELIYSLFTSEFDNVTFMLWVCKCWFYWFVSLNFRWSLSEQCKTSLVPSGSTQKNLLLGKAQFVFNSLLPWWPCLLIGISSEFRTSLLTREEWSTNQALGGTSEKGLEIILLKADIWAS